VGLRRRGYDTGLNEIILLYYYYATLTGNYPERALFKGIFKSHKIKSE